MDIRTNAQAILDYVNKVTGVELAFDDNNVASVTLDESIACFFCLVEEDHQLVVTLYLGRVSEYDTALLYELMCGNYMGAYTGGGTLGIDPREGLLALHQNFPLPMDEPAWIETPLAALFGAARYWKDKLGASRPAASVSEQPSEGMIRI